MTIIWFWVSSSSIWTAEESLYRLSLPQFVVVVVMCDHFVKHFLTATCHTCRAKVKVELTATVKKKNRRIVESGSKPVTPFFPFLSFPSSSSMATSVLFIWLLPCLFDANTAERSTLLATSLQFPKAASLFQLCTTLLLLPVALHPCSGTSCSGAS